VPSRRRPLPHDLIGLVDLEAREFQVLDDLLHGPEADYRSHVLGIQ
jgi:hypothetical protein